MAEGNYNGSRTLPTRQQNVSQYTLRTTSIPHHSANTQSQNLPAENSQYSSKSQQYTQQYPQSQYPSQQSQLTGGYNPHQQPSQQWSYSSQGQAMQPQPGHNKDIPKSYQGSTNSRSQIPSRREQPCQRDISHQGNNDWTLSTSEQCHHRQVQVSPSDEKSRFVYPSSPQRNTQPSVAKVNDIQRIDSFTKKGNGADVVRYHGTIHDDYPARTFSKK